MAVPAMLGHGRDTRGTRTFTAPKRRAPVLSPFISGDNIVLCDSPAGLNQMNNNSYSKEETLLPAGGRGLTRREWVQRLLAGAGAGIATPALAGVLMAGVSTSAAAQEKPAADEWKPAFLDDYQNQTLIALAERIVPGSTSAQVNRFLDLALDADTQQSQQKFVASLNALEGEALRQFTKSFQELSASQQDEVLTAASTGKPSNPNPASVDNPGAPPPNLRDYFDHMRGWVSLAYYSSEIGMKELGWNGENFFESFPGCQHAGGHA